MTATLMCLFMNCKIMMLEQKPTALEPTLVPDFFSECTDTPNYLDTWGGGCADYELPGNEAWCGGYGNMGEERNTSNENCCVCKALVVVPMMRFCFNYICSYPVT